jgi:hypothetical protein
MSYATPTATTTTWGVIQVGANLSITADGILSANVGSSSGGGNITIGTWTPTLTTNGAGTIGVTVKNARYSKSGQQVICMFDIQVSSITGGADHDAVLLGGLPVTSITGNGYVGGVDINYFTNLATVNYFVSGSVKSNGTTAPLWSSPVISDTKTLNSLTSYGQAALNQSDLQTSSELSGTITYLSAT